MSRLETLERRATLLQKFIAGLFGLPQDAVSIHVYVHRSQPAYEEAIEAGWPQKTTPGGVQWCMKGDGIHDNCYTIYRGIYPRPVSAENGPKT